MINIEFNSIDIENFMSLSKIHIDFDSYHGINIITGINSDENSKNGVGKSALLAAFWYALTGETPPKMKIIDIPNREFESKHFFVELKYTIGSSSYKIFRSPKKIEYVINDIDVTKIATSTNEDILKAFDVDKNTLHQSLFVSADGDISFLEKSSSDKVKHIESVLNLRVFEKLFDATKKLCNEIKKKRDVLETTIAYLEKDIVKNEMEFTSFDKNQMMKSQKIEQQIKEGLYKKSQYIVPDFKRIVDFDVKKEKLIKTIRTYEQESAVIQNSIRTKEQEVRVLKESFDCPKCKRPYDDLHTKQNEINSTTETIVELKKQHASNTEILKNFNLKFIDVDKYEENLKKEQYIQKEIEHIDNNIAQLKKSSSDLENESNPFEIIISSKKGELSSKNLEYNISKKEYKEYELLKYVYSPDGVKNFIVKKIIKLFNDILKNYLSELNSPFSLIFDEFFEETILHKKKNISYYSMSRGEKARIMLAIVFSFRELRRLQTGFNVNLTFYDEVFDMGLCSSGRTCCMKILEKHHKSFVITHRPEDMDVSKYGKIELEKRNGLTSIYA